VCLASPFERTLWIDADAVPIRGLHEMFELLAEGPWVAQEDYVTHKRAAEIYTPNVVEVCGELPEHFPEVSYIGAGVMGFNHGDPWLTEWQAMCERFIASDSLLANCRCSDQNALVTLLSQKPDVGPRVITDRRCNWAANGLAIQHVTRRKRYDWTTNLLPEFREDHPEAYVVHWCGRPKPWEVPPPVNYPRPRHYRTTS